MIPTLSLLIPAFLVVLFFLIVAYLLATFFGVAQLKAYAKVEMSNLVFSLIVVCVLLASVKGIDIAVKKITNTKLDPIHYTINYMSNTIYQAIVPLYTDVITERMIAEYFANHFVTYGPGPWGSMAAAFPGVAAVKDVLTGVCFAFSMFYATLMIQEVGLSMITLIMPLLFVLGCVIYLVPPLKNAGAYLISFSLGLWVVFPTVCTLSMVSLNMVSKELYGKPYSYYASPSALVKYSVWVMFAHVFEYTTPTLVGSMVSSGVLYPAMVIAILHSLAKVSVIALFIPSLAMLVTIAFISAGSNVLTGRVT